MRSPAEPSSAPAGRSLSSLPRVLLAAAVVVGLVIGLVTALRGPPASAAPTGSVPAGAAAPAVPDPTGAAAPTAAPGPVRATTFDVPALGILHSALDQLGVDAAGVLVPPPSAAVAGWFTGSAAPGAVGPTVIAGHVDSHAGPGIFYRLDDLKPGDIVTVGRSDGASVRYRVTDVLVVLKAEFPTDEVYGPTQGPELRLITCGGEFDRSIGHYLRNVVVSAVATGDYPGSS